jgi:hypothetical protein
MIIDHLMLKLVISWSQESLERVAFVLFVVPVYVLTVLVVLQRIVVLLFLSIEYLLIKFINLITNFTIARFFFEILLIKTICKVFVLLRNFVFVIVINGSNVLLNVGLMSFIVFVFRDLISYLFVIVLFSVINIFKVFIVIGVL